MNQPLLPRGNGYAVSRDLNPKLVPIDALTPLGQPTRKHPASQIRKLGESLEQFGFVIPIVIDPDKRVVAGWGLVLAARKIGLTEVPAAVISDLDQGKLRLLRLALNRLGEDSRWDVDALRLEFSEVLQISSEIDLRVSGFEMSEIDIALSAPDEEDVLPELNSAEPVLTEPGDVWLLGEHRLLCGDALAPDSYTRLLDGEIAQMEFTDPPWNLQIAGNVSGLGVTKHDNFAMACGEMTESQFEEFLRNSLSLAATHSEDASIHYICMHWSKMKETLLATTGIYSELKNLCIWNKANAGMGSLYRSKHELIFVFKKGTGPHINNVELGRHGRNRTNVWDYPGQNVLNGSSKSKLSLHPTAKPVALVADAIRDCSDRKGIVLDPFGGVGTTLIAAEKTGRRARLIEIDPRYVDSTVKRWTTLTGGKPVKLGREEQAGDTASPTRIAYGKVSATSPNGGDSEASIDEGAAS